MKSSEIRSRFLNFFKERGHAIIPSASLVPENDPSVLFNTAGMQPLVPYLLGEKHPNGTRLVDIQKCVRTVDIEEIGDNTHASFFEMLGNWSLGDYFKKEAIEWSYELLTSKEKGFGLDPRFLYVTVFEGNENAPRDEESYKIWNDIFIKNGISGERIYFMPAKSNWWSAGENGPSGPDTEMFYNVTGKDIGGMSKEQYLLADEKQQVVEIWNDVFMQYMSKNGKVEGKLPRHNVDTGSGLERVTMVVQGKDNIYATDLFQPIMDKIDEFTVSDDKRARRIVADHVRTAVFMISDGVLPSNTDRGYILRRLIRRAVRFADVLNMKHGSLFQIADTVIDNFKETYPNLAEKREQIKTAIDVEEHKFRKTLKDGLREFEKIAAASKSISGQEAFLLFSSYGFPIEITQELAKERGISVDTASFDEEFKRHQELSRSGAEKKFKGGLADTSEMSLKYHTATHLLNAALRQVLGNHVMQKGSNITPERLRFDFNHPAKMTDDEKKRVEEIVNEKIQEALPVTFVEMKADEARKGGAIGVFDEKYGETVKVYRIGNPDKTFFSQEFCGGPHVKNTSELGRFKIQKEEAVSAGIRRIKAVLE